MSELDLGSGPTATGGQQPTVSNALVLAPPAPVVVVEKEQAAAAVPVDAARQAELQARARGFATELASLDPKSPAFAQKVTSITVMGDQDMRAAASMSNRMLDRPAAALGKGAGDAQ